MTNTTVFTDVVALSVNGRECEVPVGSTLADLLRSLNLDSRVVVVEHNREIVRDAAALSERRVATGDKVEIVHFVGGG